MDYTPMRAINLTLSDFMDLEFHLMDTRPGVSPDTFVAELVRHWLAVDKERSALRRNGRPMRGFQWKTLFLPEGTCLRTSHHDTVEYAKVIGDRIRTDQGEAVTPSQLVNRQGKGRNAWRLIWLRFPGEAEVGGSGG